MAKLSDLFVRITGDDRPYNATAEKVRKSLNAIDRTKVEPQVSLPNNVTAEVDQLSRKLQALSKQRVSLNVNSTVANADIATLTRKLETLQRNRTSVPVELGEKADREIADLQRELAALQRRQTRVPLTIERIDSKVAAVRSQLASLENNPFDVDVDVDRDNSLRGRMGRVRQTIATGLNSGGEVDAAGRKAGDRFGGSFATVARNAIGLAVVYGGLTAAVGLLREANAEAIESQKVGAVTAQIIKSTGGAAKISADQVGALTMAISNKTGMDDEAIQSGANLLLTFKNVRNEVGQGANIFDRATQSAVDLSAAGFGSVEGASKMLGKALNDPIKGISALSRAGVTFTDQQKEQIKTLVASGDVLGAQKIILGEVESQVGGVAEASATMGEKLATASANFKEQIGTALLPLIERFQTIMVEKVVPAASAFVREIQSGEGAGGRFRDIVTGIADAFMTGVGAIKSTVQFTREYQGVLIPLGGSIAVVAAGMKVLAVQQAIVSAGGLLKFIQGVAGATRLWAGAQAVLNVALTANPIGIIVVAVAALVAGVILAYKHSETFRNVVNAVGQALKTGFLAAVNGVRTAIAWLGTAWTSVASSTSSAWAKIKAAVQTGWTAIVGFFRTAGAVILAPIVAVWNAVREATARVLGIVGTVIKAAVQAWLTVFRVQLAIIGAVVLTAWRAMQATVDLAMKGIRAVIDAIWKAIGPIVTRAVTGVRTTIATGWRIISETTTSVWNSIRTFISRTWGLIQDGFRIIMAAIRTAFSTWWTNLSTRATAAFNAIREFLSRTWSTIRNSVFGDAMRLIRDAFSQWWTNLTSRATSAFNSMRDFLSRTWATIRGLWERAQSGVRGIWDSFWNTIKRVGSDAIGSVKSRIDTVFGQIRRGTETFVSNVGRIFSGIRGAFSAPWDWVSRNVFGRIASAYNAVARVVGAPTLNLATGGPVNDGGASARTGSNIRINADGGPIDSRAAGGPIRGIGGPRQDNIAGIDRMTGVQTSWVSNREYVVNARSTEANRPLVEAINAAHGPLKPDQISERMFLAAGGPVRLFAGGATPHPGPYRSHSLPYYGARIAGDFGSGYGGTPAIKAWKDGVVAATQSLTTSYGKNIRINHGKEWTRYAHMNSFAVRPGQRVRAGQTIGRGGWTGNVQPRGPGGAHLHFEVHGGKSGIMSAVSGAVEKLIEMIKPREMLRTAARPILAASNAGFNALPDNPFRRMIQRFPSKFVDMLANKLPASFGIESDSGGSSYDGPVGSGASGIRAIANSYKPTYIAAHRDPQGGPAFDIGSSGAKNTAIGNALRANHSKLGLRYVIRQMQIASARGGWGWRPYTPITSSGDWRHVQHVHVSYANGGQVGLANGGIVKGGRGGVTAQIGEGRFDEIVSPLPRGWNAAGTKRDQIDELVRVLRERPAGEVKFEFHTYNPIREAESVTTNKALQRVADLGLV